MTGIFIIFENSLMITGEIDCASHLCCGYRKTITLHPFTGSNYLCTLKFHSVIVKFVSLLGRQIADMHRFFVEFFFLNKTNQN